MTKPAKEKFNSVQKLILNWFELVHYFEEQASFLIFITWVHATSLQLCPTFLRPYGLQPARLLCLWESPGRNTGVGCHALCQGTSRPRDQTHVSLCLLHWQAGSLPLALAVKSFLHHSTGLFLFYFVLQILCYATITKIYKGIGLWTFT